MKDFWHFMHTGNIGDIIASLPCIKEVYEKEGKKGIYYIWKNRKAIYYEGAVHPTKADDGKTMVMINDKMLEMLIPLLNAQEYIHEAKEWSGEEIDVNFNKIREVNLNTSVGSLSRWYFYVYPNLATDLSKPYISVPDTDKDFAKNKILINRTERYTNEIISYFFIKKYNSDAIFAGTKGEYEKFCSEWKLGIPYLEVNDFLELAQAIKQSLLFIGNQSMCFQIAEGLKHPRVLETCSFAPNVIPIGENAYDFYAQIGLEHYVENLYKKLKK